MSRGTAQYRNYAVPHIPKHPNWYDAIIPSSFMLISGLISVPAY